MAIRAASRGGMAAHSGSESARQIFARVVGKKRARPTGNVATDDPARVDKVLSLLALMSPRCGVVRRPGVSSW